MSVNFLMDKKAADAEKSRREREGEDVSWTHPEKEETVKVKKELPDLREDLKKIEKKPKESSAFIKKLAGFLAKKKREAKKDKVILPPHEYIKNISEKREEKPAVPKTQKVNKFKFFSNLFLRIKKIFIKNATKPIIHKIEDTRQEAPHMAKERHKHESALIQYSEGEKTGVGNPKILESNLIKGQALHFFNWEKNIVALIVAILISLLILTLGYWELKNREDKKIADLAELTDRIEVTKTNINNISKLSAEAKNFQKKLYLVNEMLNKHVYWTNFFKFLEEKTLAQVWYLGGFSGDLTGKYTFNARTMNYSLVEAQVEELLKSPYVSQAQVGGGTVFAGTEDLPPGIDFVLNFTVKPDLFSDFIKH